MAEPIIKPVAAGLFFDHAQHVHAGQFAADGVDFVAGFSDQITDVEHLGGIGQKSFQKLDAGLGDKKVFEHFSVPHPWPLS